jgi:TetR/AcrR family transcriptional regulator, cholesterol catabolism regulator
METTDTQKRIQQKAHELFMRYGIRSMNMDEIANRLGMSKKTIYQYFEDKDALVDAVIDDEIEQTQVECKLTQNDSKNAVDEIFQVMEYIDQQFREINPLVLYDLQRYHHKAFTKFLEHKNSFLLQVIRLNLERGKQEELFRPELDVEIIARHRLESMMLAFNMEVFPSGRFNLAAISRELIEHYLFGLVTLKGYKLVLKYKNQRLKKSTLHEKALAK